MTPLAIIRPQPGCDTTVAAARALGLDARAFPMFDVAPLAWQAPEPDTFDALLIGSANALRHGGAALARYRDKPVHAVGEHTAAAARQQGFVVSAVGATGLQAVLDAAAQRHRRFLRLAGRERVPIAPPDGVNLIERFVYASEQLAMSPALAGLLAGGALVLLHSAEAARHFAGECARLGIARAGVALAALAPRVGEAAGDGWAAKSVALSPRDDALLALAQEMCQTDSASKG